MTATPYIIKLKDIDNKTQHVNYTIDNTMLHNITHDLNIPYIYTMQATLTISKSSLEHSYHVSGVMEAKVQYICAISLKKFDDVIHDIIDIHYAYNPVLKDENNEIEELYHDYIDVTNIMVESLALSYNYHNIAPNIGEDNLQYAIKKHDDIAVNAPVTLADTHKPLAGLASLIQNKKKH